MPYQNIASAEKSHPSHSASVPLPVVRQSVKALLLASPAYQELDPQSQRTLAHKMVSVCQTAAGLILEEIDSEQTVRDLEGKSEAGEFEDRAQPLSFAQDESAAELPLVATQSAADDFGGKAVDRLAGDTQRIINAVSFPRFVAELINGVFKAIVDSDMQQMHMYIELLNNVAASTEGFADTNMAPSQARTWLVERFPGSFELVEDDGDDDFWGDRTTQNPPTKIRLRSGAKIPSQAALQAALGFDDKRSLPTSGNPERTLLPLVRRHLAKTRQQMLATLVQMGMQRIVIESGRINATMRFHIDARSAAQADKGSRFDMTNKASVNADFGVGPWGVDAQLQNTIGYVSTERSHTTEEQNADVELTSSVELNFKSDYVPLNRLTNSNQAKKIVANSRNSEFESARKQEAARRAKTATQDADRHRALDKQLSPRKQAYIPSKPAKKTSTSNKPPTKKSSATAKPPAKKSPKPQGKKTTGTPTKPIKPPAKVPKAPIPKT